MIPPTNCPYKEMTAPTCWSCPNYNVDLDEHDRQQLLKLSKEALVDLIIKRPTMF